MNLAIEYILRDKRAHSMLCLPCSLFLNDKESSNRLVITIHNCYGESKKITIKHWKLWEDKVDNQLPPFIEFSIARSEMFTNEHTVLKDYNILEFVEDSYRTGAKQYAESPQALEQNAQYTTAVEWLFNPPSHKDMRLNWLWDQFEKTHVTEDLKWQYGNGTRHGKTLQRDIVEFYSPKIWRKWTYWRKHLLDFQCFLASELAFKREYKKETVVLDEPAITSTTGIYSYPFVWTTTTATTSTFPYWS